LNFLIALVSLLVSGLLGWSWVVALTIHYDRLARARALTVALATLDLAVLVAAFASGAGWATLILAVLAIVVGYVLRTRKLLAPDESRVVPELTRRKTNPGLGHTAVIYFTHGEPESYDPIGWINQFNEFDEQGIPFVPLVARPWFIRNLRASYMTVGTSHHRQIHHRMIEALRQRFLDNGDASTRFYLSFLDDDPRPDVAVIQALNEGASRIVVAEVFLTVSNHTAEGRHLIEMLQVEDYVPVTYTGPMWDSELLTQMFVERTNANLNGAAKGDTAVLLVGHGQPGAWDVEWPTETEHELAFRRGVLDALAADGYDPRKLGIAWMEFKEPKPAALIEHFVGLGAKRILYFSAAISADSLHSQYDVPELVEKARVPESIELVNLGAWNDEPLVISAIKEKIDAVA